MSTLRGRVVTPDAVLEDGVVASDGAVITYVGPFSQAPEDVRAAAGEATVDTLLPGLVDIHNHGGGGGSIPDASDPDEVRTAVAEHRAHGTVAQFASLVTAQGDALVEKVAMLAELAEDGEIAGIHLEGPFISVDRCGAQNPTYIVPGDADLMRRIMAAGRGYVRTMTIAPETENLEAVLRVLADGQAVPSFGHTDADAVATRAAIATAVGILAGTGLRPTITHLFNGMRPVHHRRPGPVPPALAAAERGEVIVELIGDGVHLDTEMVRDVFTLVGAQNVALVTDAMAAAGMADGAYRLGSLDVTVAGGVARLSDGGSIAGGTAHLVDVVRTSVAGGVPLLDAVTAASLTPAGVLVPPSDLGALRVGAPAWVLRTDADLNLLDVVSPDAPVA